MPVEDLPLFPPDVLVDKDRLDRFVYGVCVSSEYAGTLDGFSLEDLTWNHSTHQAEYELAEAHYYAVLSTIDASNPLVMLVISQIISAKMASLDVSVNDI